MAVMDEFKEERALMKKQPFKKRFQYFWDYYKWHVLIISIVAIASISLIHSIVSHKDLVFMVGLVDCYSDEVTAPKYTKELTELMGIDTAHQEIRLDNSFFLSGLDTMEGSSGEILSLRIMAEELSVMLAPEDIFNRYVQNGIFRDIREVLSPEQLAYYEDSFYYVDYAVIESEAIYKTDFIQTGFKDEANHRSPEGMEKPVPVGIYVTGTEEFQGYYYFPTVPDQEVVFGITHYTDPADYALMFLDNMTGRVE